MKRILSLVILCFMLFITTSPFMLSTTHNSKDFTQDNNNYDNRNKNNLVTNIHVSGQQITWKEYNDKNRNNVHDKVDNIFSTHVKESVLICYDQIPVEEDIDALIDIGVEVNYNCKYVNVIVTGEISKRQLDKIVHLSGVTFIEPLPVIKPLLDVSARSIKARDSSEYSPNTAWELGYTGKGITIAVLDTGVDDSHPDLEGKFIAGADFAGATGRITTKNGRYNPDDDTGHGTAIAGIALSNGGADEAYKGVAPDARLVDVRVTLGRGGDIITALEWCIDHKNTDWNNNGIDDYDGIDIISISVGGDDNSDGSDSVSQLVNRVVDAGIVVVTAIGNSGPNNQGIGNVAAADKVITVGNLNDQNTVDRSDDELDSTSSKGPRRDDGDDDPYDELKPDVTAPGMSIMTPDFSLVGQRGTGYDVYSGSSMSCPHVSGICALILEANPELQPKEIKRILQSTAEDIGEPSEPELSDKYNYGYGYGSVDAYAAVREAQSYEPSNHRPELKSISTKPKFVEPNGEVTITTLATDEDGDMIYYNYTATGGEIIGTGSQVTWKAPDTTGTFEISVIVNDGLLFSEPMNVTITVDTEPINHAPAIDNIKADPTVVSPGGNATIIVTASDPDDDELFFEYNPNGGEIIGAGFQVVWLAPKTSGRYTISITVNDGELNSETKKVVITVEGEVENKPPEIDSIIATPPSVATGGSVRLFVTAIDPEDGKLDYSYQITSGTIKGTGNDVTWTAPDEPGGEIIEVTVTDEFGLSDLDDLFIDVFEQNFPPVILNGRATPSDPKSDGKTEILFTVLIEDPNGLDDISRVTIDLSSIFGSENQQMHDDGKQGDKNRNDGIFSYSYLLPRGIQGGPKILTVRAEDRYNEVNTNQLYINVTAAPAEEDKGVIGEYLPIPGFEAGFLFVAFILLLSILVRRRREFKNK